MEHILRLEYKEYKQKGLVWMFLNGILHKIVPSDISSLDIKENAETWVSICSTIGVDYVDMLESAMNSVYTEELLTSLISKLQELDSLERPYNIFYTFILVIYARTRYERFPLRDNPRTVMLDSIGISWETFITDNGLDKYITRCVDYINENT